MSGANLPPLGKVAEIEGCADEVERVTIEAKLWAEKKADAVDNLVASMRRHGVNSYSRATWGLVTVEDGKPKVKVKLSPKVEG